MIDQITTLINDRDLQATIEMMSNHGWEFVEKNEVDTSLQKFRDFSSPCYRVVFRKAQDKRG